MSSCSTNEEGNKSNEQSSLTVQKWQHQDSRISRR